MGFNPFEKYYIVKMDSSSPDFRGTNLPNLCCHHPDFFRTSFQVCLFLTRPTCTKGHKSVVTHRTTNFLGGNWKLSTSTNLYTPWNEQQVCTCLHLDLVMVGRLFRFVLGGKPGQVSGAFAVSFREGIPKCFKQTGLTTLWQWNIPIFQ